MRSKLAHAQSKLRERHSLERAHAKPAEKTRLQAKRIARAAEAAGLRKVQKCSSSIKSEII